MGLIFLLSKNQMGILTSVLLQFKNQSITPTNMKCEVSVIIPPSCM